MILTSGDTALLIVRIIIKSPRYTGCDFMFLSGYYAAAGGAAAAGRRFLFTR